MTTVQVNWKGQILTATDVDSEPYVREFTQDEYAAAGNPPGVIRKGTCRCPRIKVSTADGVVFTAKHADAWWTEDQGIRITRTEDYPFDGVDP